MRRQSPSKLRSALPRLLYSEETIRGSKVWELAGKRVVLSSFNLGGWRELSAGFLLRALCTVRGCTILGEGRERRCEDG